MIENVSALQVRQGLGRILNEAYYKGSSFVVERAKKPMAVIVPIDEFLVWEERKAQLSQIIKGTAERVGLSEGDALKLVSEAREEVVRA